MIIFKILLLLCTYVFLYFSTSVISEKNIKINLRALLCILLVTLINVCVFKLTNGFLKGFVTLIGFFIYANIAQKLSLKESVIAGFVMYLYVVIGEIISSIILVTLKLDGFIAGSNNLGFYKLVFSTIYTLCLYLLTYIPAIKRILIKLKKSIIEFKYLYYVLIFIFFIFEVSIVLLLLNTNNQYESILSILLIIIIAVGVSVFIHSLSKNTELELLNNSLKNKNESFLKVLNNYKMFKHNMKHELNAISRVGNKKVKALVEEYIKEYEIDCNLNVDDILKMPDGIKEIMYQKIIESKDIPCNIAVDNNLDFDPFKRINIKTQCKLNQCLGIVFDNAIEAARECDNGFVYVRLYKQNDKIYIEFSNNFTNQINIDELGRKEKSSKNSHYGIGLMYINSQKDFNITTMIRNNIYTIKIQIC